MHAFWAIITCPVLQGGAECSQRVRVTAFQSERASAAAVAPPVRCDSADSQLAAALAASAAGAPEQLCTVCRKHACGPCQYAESTQEEGPCLREEAAHLFA